MKKNNHFLQKYEKGYVHLATRTKAFLQRSWYKLSLLLLIAMVFSYKDLSVRFDLSSPFSKDKQPPRKEQKNAPSGGQLPDNQGFTDLGTTSRKEVFSIFPNFFKRNSKKEKAKNLFQLLETVNRKQRHDFIERFSGVAVEEMKQFGVPASIILAQALLHSQAGTSSLSKEENNLFSITCGSSWQERSVEVDGVCYRSYISAWKSFRDHSTLVTKGRFATLTQFASTDYKQWAAGLAAGGYSIEKDYESQLLQTIQLHSLDKFDR